MSDVSPASTSPEALEAGMDAPPPTAAQLVRWVLLSLTVLIGVGILRVSLQSHQQFSAGRLMETRNDVPSAVLAYRHAAEAWAPFSATGAALDRLDAIAATCHLEADTICELMALRAMRTSILSIRSFWVPHAGRLPDIHARIAEGMALQAAPESERVQASERYRQQLDSWTERTPSRPLALTASVLFVLWLLSFPSILIAATPADGPLRWRVLLSGLAVNLLLAATWLMAVYHA